MTAKARCYGTKDTKDTEIVPIDESIDDYMEREVLPYVPDAEAFFEEDLSKKKPVVKTGAEIPFTRYFYKYEQPESSEELKSNSWNSRSLSMPTLLNYSEMRECDGAEHDG